MIGYFSTSNVFSAKYLFCTYVLQCLVIKFINPIQLVLMVLGMTTWQAKADPYTQTVSGAHLMVGTTNSPLIWKLSTYNMQQLSIIILTKAGQYVGTGTISLKYEMQYPKNIPQPITEISKYLSKNAKLNI